MVGLVGMVALAFILLYTPKVFPTSVEYLYCYNVVT